MSNKFLLIFLIFAIYGLYTNDVSLHVNFEVKEDIQKKNEQETKPPSYYCDHEKSLFLCSEGTRQGWILIASCLWIFYGFSCCRSQRDQDRVIQPSEAPSLFKMLAIAAWAITSPYIARYKETGHIGPTCYHTAFLSPTLLFEIPYVFYQRRKTQERLNRALLR